VSGFDDLAAMVTLRPLSRPIIAEGRRSPFKAPWRSTISLLAKELRAHAAEMVVLEIDYLERDLRVDGLPRADRRAQSPGIAVSFKACGVAGSPHLRYEVGTFNDWTDNLRAIALGLESLRAVDRYGVTKRGEQYQGWKALPIGSGPSADRGHELIREHGGIRQALHATHPDHGGDALAFADVQAARGLA
jgi:hypothetical protein